MEKTELEILREEIERRKSPTPSEQEKERLDAELKRLERKKFHLEEKLSREVTAGSGRDISGWIKTAVEKKPSEYEFESEQTKNNRTRLVRVVKKMDEIEGLIRPAPKAGTAEELAYLERTARLLESGKTPEIYHGMVAPERRMGYSLKVDDSLVYHLEPNGGCIYIFTGNKTQPFKLKSSRATLPFFAEAQSTVNLGMCDYLTEEGVKLFGAARDRADEIFTKVRVGKEILPPRREGEVYYEKGRERTENIHPRHWGQSYLAGRNPINVTHGELFASGNSFMAYNFGDLVVVESDQSGDATYVLKTGAFEDLRHKSRDWILTHNPEGFVTRVIHPGDSEAQRQVWKRQVDPYITS